MLLSRQTVVIIIFAGVVASVREDMTKDCLDCWLRYVCRCLVSVRVAANDGQERLGRTGQLKPVVGKGVAHRWVEK